MKKILSLLLASVILAAAGCAETKETTTTTTEAPAAEATTTTEAPVEETTTTAEKKLDAGEFGVDSLLTDDMIAFIDELEAKGAPIYANYMVESSMLPTGMGFAYEADLYGTGTNSVVTMEVYMKSMDTMAVKTVTDGVASDIIIKDKKTYILSGAEKTAIYMTLSDEEVSQMTEGMTASVKPAFDINKATVETGTETFNGAEYLYEKITTDEAGEIAIYADKDTKEIKYLVSAGVTMEMTLLTHDVDNSIFEVPADYTLIDMASLAQ